VFWEPQLNQSTLEDSQFDENLNISLLDDKTVFIGDRYQAGCVVIEVTQPRIPSFKLDIRLQQETFPAQFLAEGRLGFYLRVELSGEFKLGDSFSLLQRGRSGVTVFDSWRAIFTAGGDRGTAKKALDSLPDLDVGWRKRLAGRLKR
jgi:MOSC domain-containing protein YiiM